MHSPWSILPKLNHHDPYPWLWEFADSRVSQSLIYQTQVTVPQFQTPRQDMWGKGKNHVYQAREVQIYRNVSFLPRLSTAIHNKKILSNTFMSLWRCEQAQQRGLIRDYPTSRETGFCSSIDFNGSRNYYHFHIITLARLFSLHHPFLRKLPEIKLFTTMKLPPRKEAVFRSMLPKNVRLIQVEVETQIKPDYYIHLPYLVQEWDGFLPPQFIQFFRRKVFRLLKVNPFPKPKKKYYVSRQETGQRMLLNDADVREFLKGHGYKTLESESLSMRAQATAFKNASHVILQHGAGMTNMIFGKNIKVLEIHSGPREHDTHFEKYCLSLGHKHRFIELLGKGKHDDVELPLELLEPFLDVK